MSIICKITGGGTETDLLEKDGSLFVKSEYKIIRINVADICYIEGMSEYVRIYTDAADKARSDFAEYEKAGRTLAAGDVHGGYIGLISSIFGK